MSSNPQTKPLPRLPRGCARTCHQAGLHLRSIGLSIVVSTLSGNFEKDFKEPTKVAIRRNRVTASLGALVHVIPMGIALLEITLNWAGCYYGKQFERQAYYQIAAKTHEVLIQASLAAIVLSCIRFESAFGQDIPFGAFLGSLQLLQVSYLCSSELWSSFTLFQLRRKSGIIALLIISSILAASAGQSSATMLIPRLIYWSLASSHLAVNGTFQDVWPDRMSSSKIPRNCSIIPMIETHSICPAGPWATLPQNLAVYTNKYSINTLISGLKVLQVSVSNIQSSNVVTLCPCLTSNKQQQCANTVHDVVLEGTQSAISQ